MSIDDIRDEFEADFDFSEEDFGEEPAAPDLFLGMTAPQRFVIALLLFFTVLIISAFCLIVTGKIALPL